MNVQPESVKRHCGNCGTTGDEGCTESMEELTEISTGCGLKLWSPLKPWQIAMQYPESKKPVPPKVDGRTKAARFIKKLEHHFLYGNRKPGDPRPVGLLRSHEWSKK
jgi:hypothetical protein